MKINGGMIIRKIRGPIIKTLRPGFWYTSYDTIYIVDRVEITVRRVWAAGRMKER